MIVVSSGQLAQSTTSKPFTIAVPGQAGGAAKTVTLAAAGGTKVAPGGQQLITSSSGQILAVQPAQGIVSGAQVRI